MKILFTLVFLISISLTPSGAWPAYILSLAVILSVSLISQIKQSRILLRSLISLPFALAAIPLIFTGSEPYYMISIGSWTVALSQPGLVQFVSIAIKSWLSVLIAILLITTTHFSELLCAFRSLGVPRIFISILSLMGRYLSLIIDEANRLMQARASRSTAYDDKHRSGGTFFWRAEITGKLAGNLLLRSLERSDRVYIAMCARGYTGEPFSYEDKTLTRNELLILLGGFSCLAVILLIGLVFH